MPRVFLIGFMASGKSAVARRLSERLHMPCIDLDSNIEDAAGLSISAIFAAEGEAGFRARERDALMALRAAADAVVATGGGAPCWGDNLAIMKKDGMVVHLSTALDTALGRVDDPSTRPLLQLSRHELEALYRERQPVYRRAQLSVSTDDRSIDAVVDEIEAGLAVSESLPADLSELSTTVALGARSYPVVTGRGLLSRSGELIAARCPDLTRVAILSDDHVAPLYGAELRRSLEAAGMEVVEQVVEAGEGSKSINVYSRCCDELIAAGLDRRSLVIALGGGVVGDLAGFVAATLLRGVRVVQLPTSLLAMTDSAIGGKTGINSAHGKNLIGSFWQPQMVLSDVDTLATLPLRERRAAFGELVKYALLDGALFEGIEAMAGPLCADEAAIDDEMCATIRGCAAVKASIVSIDERERGLRATLNLGHTVGHAIESAAGYGQVLHGEAVALGLIAACRVSCKMGLCDAQLESRVRSVLEGAGLDTDLTPWLRDEVLERLRVDKKRTSSQVRFIAVAKPGDVRICEMELDELDAQLRTE
jgi:3-dehydroquinate synthase